MRIRVAVAEDHTLVREGIVSFVNSCQSNVVVTQAANGRELIDSISQLEEAPDVCTLDVSMPILNGYDTIRELKYKYPQMKFLALSMFEHEYSIIRMIKLGANGYLNKNCSPKELNAAIQSIYETDFYYSKTASEDAFTAVRKYKINELTSREIHFLSLISSELSYKEIADQLHISVRTVQDYQENISKKVNIKTRTGLVLFAIQSGII